MAGHESSGIFFFPSPPAGLSFLRAGSSCRTFAAGEKALCLQCDAVLAKHSHLGPDTTLTLTLSGLILAPPALLLPFITARILGRVHSGWLFSGVTALWDEGMPILGVWVLACSLLAPLLLLGTLAGLLLPPRFSRTYSPRP